MFPLYTCYRKVYVNNHGGDVYDSASMAIFSGTGTVAHWLFSPGQARLYIGHFLWTGTTVHWLFSLGQTRLYIFGYFLWGRHDCTFLVIFSGVGTIHWLFSLEQACLVIGYFLWDRYTCTLLIFSGVGTTVYWLAIFSGTGTTTTTAHWLFIFSGIGTTVHRLFSLEQVWLYIGYFLSNRYECTLVGYFLWDRHVCTLTGTPVHWLFFGKGASVYWLFSVGEERLYIDYFLWDRHACTLFFFIWDW